MRYCWSHEDDHVNVLFPGVMMVGILGFAQIIQISLASNDPIRMLRSSLILFTILYALPFRAAMICARRYQLSSYGLLVVYPFGIKRMILWEQISEIALCKMHYASGSSKHILGIRCALDEECCVPKNARSARASWSSMAYEFRFHRKLVSIYYTPQRFEEFQRFCPFKIVDLWRLKDCD